VRLYSQHTTHPPIQTAQLDILATWHSSLIRYPNREYSEAERTIPHTTAPFQHWRLDRHTTHPQNPLRGETTTVPVSYPATRKIPATLHDQANKNAGNNSPHRIRTIHPTIQNYCLNTTSITYVFIIHCTYTDICSRYNTPRLWPRFFLVCM
jgi:hypothetical protein